MIQEAPAKPRNNIADNRNYSVDLAKVVGMMLVVGVHFLYKIGYYEKLMGGPTMSVMNIVYIVLMTCVPLFLIATGYVLSTRTFGLAHYKKLLPLLINILVISFFASILRGIRVGDVEIPSIFDYYVNLLFYEPNYYISLYINLYILAPLLNLGYSAIPKDRQLHFILVLVLIISMPRFFNYNLGIQFFEYRYILAFPILYYFIGLYIKDCKSQYRGTTKLLIILLSGSLYSIFQSYYRFGLVHDRIFGNYENIFIVVAAAFLFSLIVNIEIKSDLSKKMLVSFSAVTLSIYIIAPVFSDIIVDKMLPTYPNLLLSSYKILIAMVLSPMIVYPFGLVINQITQCIVKLIDRILLEIGKLK